MSLVPRMSKQQGLFRMGMLIATKANATRAISSSVMRQGVIDSKSEVAPAYARIKPLQELFQRDDGRPVHLKLGAKDYALYYLTIGMTGICLIMTFQYFYTQAFPKKGK